MWLEIFLVIVTVLVIAVLAIKRFLYFHPTFVFANPTENYQDIYEGNLHAWYKEAGKGTQGPVILFCHGNGGNLSYRQGKLAEFNKIGISVLIFDYSGFGYSRGVPTEQLCYSNASTFYEYLLKMGYSNTNIIPYGESLGGPVASYIARKYNCPKVIIESGLPGVKYLLSYRVPWLKFLSIFFSDFDMVSFLTGYRGKSLVIHSTDDEIIPYTVTEPVQKLATIFLPMQGNHNDPRVPWDKIREFINN